VIVVGSRGSALALAQAAIVTRALGEDATVRVITTAGDTSDRPIRELGDGVFVSAIEDALRRGDVDIAVHSLKDLPTQEAADLVIAAIPAREDVRDVLVTRGRDGLAGLREGAVVGTSSLRRAAFITALRPDVTCADIRGNVDTRLRKVDEGRYDATILAAAGLRRLAIAFGADEALPIDLCPPAPGQGALALQVRASDVVLRVRLVSLDDARVHAAVIAERELLRLLGASCDIPLGAHGHWDGAVLVLDAALAGGHSIQRTTQRGQDPLELARRGAVALGSLARA
jgi:hydroxymethylbilane synthase